MAKKNHGLKVQDILNNPKVQAALQKRAAAVLDYWKSVAPVFDPSDPREHRTTPSRGAPGDYRDSIVAEDHEREDGVPYVRIKATDFKAKWIEYGSSHMPEYAPASKTRARYRK